MVGYQPDIDQAGFSQLGERLLGGGTQVHAITAAPGLVVSMVHPLDEHGAAIGADARRNAVARRDFSKGGARSMTFEGPRTLHGGAAGFVVSAPVSCNVDDRLAVWGLVSAEIDARALYRASGLNEDDHWLEVALIGRDGRPEGGDVFFGDPTLPEREPVVAKVVLPGGAWRLAATPTGAGLRRRRRGGSARFSRSRRC